LLREALNQPRTLRLRQFCAQINIGQRLPQQQDKVGFRHQFPRGRVSCSPQISSKKVLVLCGDDVSCQHGGDYGQVEFCGELKKLGPHLEAGDFDACHDDGVLGFLDLGGDCFGGLVCGFFIRWVWGGRLWVRLDFLVHHVRGQLYVNWQHVLGAGG
jgi:hypothetical protein